MEEEKDLELRHAEVVARGICEFCGDVSCKANPPEFCLFRKVVALLYRKRSLLKSNWISVEDRLPNNEDRVLVYIKANHLSETAIDTDRVVNGRWVRWGTLVTHWMLLPDAPW